MEALVAPFIQRLSDEVAELSGRVYPAADQTALARFRAAPQADTAAFVMSLGLEGRPNDRATGVHSQVVTRRVGVVLILRGAHPTAAQVVDRAEAMILTIVAALAGWVAPGAMRDPVEFRSAAITSAGEGLFSYLIQFSARDLLRIAL